MPTVAQYVDPSYPPAAAKAGVEGEVVLRLTIEKDGRVSDAEVMGGPGHGLNRAAWDAARQLRFVPAKTEAGKAIRSRILFKYEFRLEPSAAATQPAAPLPTRLEGTLIVGAGHVNVAGATIVVAAPSGATWRVLSDGRGRFELSSLPPGRLHVTITATGYETLELDETLAAGEQLEVRYRLRRPGEDAGSADAIDVYVEGTRPSREVVQRRLGQREIDRIPGTRGDALRSVQSLPGVARPPGMSGLLIVRGSAPEDSQTFIDRMNVPLTYHFGGLSSVIPTELLKGIEFYPGNFSSRYGRVMGGIVDVELRSPRSDGYHGLAQLDFIDARAVFEGPIPGTDSWSFLLAGRRSYIDAWLGPALEASGANVAQAPVYWDYQFLVEHKSTPETRLRLSVIGSDDGFEIVGGDGFGGFNLHTAFQRAQLYVDHDSPEGHSFDGSVAFARDVLDFDVGAFFVSIHALSVFNRMEYGHRLADSLKLNLGLDFSAGMADVGLRIPSQPPPGQPAVQPGVTSTTDEAIYQRPFVRPAAYVELEATPFDKLRLIPGVRVDYTVESEHFDLSPRFNGRLELFDEFPQTAFRAGVGIYRQPPVFLEIVEPLGNPELESEMAVHYGVGVDQDITRQLEVSLDGYIKQLENLVVGVPSAGYTNDGAGMVYGGELMLKYKPDEHFFGWLAYTLSRSERRDAPDGMAYLFDYDQTHNLTVLGSYRIGRGWEVGARFRLASGNLTTPTICDPEDDGCNPNGVNAIYHAASASYLAFDTSGRNSERLPIAHQLDLRVEKVWSFDAWKLSWFVDLHNVYNHQAAEFIYYNYNFTDRAYLGGLPFFPSMGIRGKF